MCGWASSGAEWKTAGPEYRWCGLPEGRQCISADPGSAAGCGKRGNDPAGCHCGEKGTTEPVRIVYDGDVSTVSRAAGSDVQTVKSRSSNGKAGTDNGTQARRTEPRYAEPLPVLLTRYAAQSLYAPLRTLEPVAGIRPVVPHLPRQITTVYPSEPLTVSPVAAWAAGGRTVVALKLTSTVSRRIVLDPRALQGRFVAATFQHRWLGAAGTPEDTTMLYVVTAGSPEKAFVEEPVTSRRGGEVTHAD